MSWKVQVKTDDSDRWYNNSMRYATREEAVKAMDDLERRWATVRASRVVESNDPVRGKDYVPRKS